MHVEEFQVKYLVHYIPSSSGLRLESDEEWAANNLVKAVKGWSLGKSESPISWRGSDWLLNTSTTAQAPRIFATIMADLLFPEERARHTLHVFVPIPSSRAIAADESPGPTLTLASELALAVIDRQGVGVVEDRLRFRKVFEPGYKGRARSEQEIYDNMVFLSSAQEENDQPAADVTITLVDDVLTQGHHMLAARRLLAENGWRVGGGLTVGRSVYDRRPSFQLFTASLFHYPSIVYRGGVPELE